MLVIESPAQLTERLAGRHFINAEFMYKPRPGAGREQIVFDATLSSRLGALGTQDAVLFIANSLTTVDSLAPFERQFPLPLMLATIANPEPTTNSSSATPERLGWPGNWQRYQKTDRWARIELALTVAGTLAAPGYLIMPAHDALWGRNVLDRLVRFSQCYERGGFPAAVSAYTYYQHSAIPGANIPQSIIDLMNTAFGRDALFSLKIRLDRMQAFWGKMGMLPFGLCKPILERAEKMVWEDDLEIDRVIRAMGYGVRCLWVRDPKVYRQAPPVFDREGLRKVIERTLHYSLNIPNTMVGESSLNYPLGVLGELRCLSRPKFRRYNAQAEALIAECNTVIMERLARFGASWVDWGAYRYVMRVGDPVVEVWKRERTPDVNGV